MTNEELQAIVATVVQELQNSGTEITGTAVQNSLKQVNYLLGLNGTALVRVSPGVVNEGESKNATDIAAEVSRAQAAEQQLQGNISDEVARAQAAEEELRGAINTGGGVSLGSFDSASEFNNRLNTLTYDPAVTGKNIGFFRAKVSHRDAEVKNILLSSGLNVIVQVVEGTFVSVDNTLTLTDSGYNVFTRKHENGAWSEWLKWNGDVSDEQLTAIYAAINAEAERAQAAEAELRELIGTGGSVPEGLVSQVSQNATAISRNKASIDSEVARAKGVEDVLRAGTTMRFDGIESEDKELLTPEAFESDPEIIYLIPKQKFVYRKGTTYYDDDGTLSSYNADGNIRKDKLYLLNATIYAWNGSNLVVASSTGGGEIDPAVLAQIEVNTDDINAIKEVLDYTADYTPEIGNGTQGNAGNQVAIRTNEKIPGEVGKTYTIITNRPPDEGCIYVYGYYTYKVLDSAIWLDSKRMVNYDANSTINYVTLEEGEVGFGFTIAQWNATTGQYVNLRASYFSGFEVKIKTSNVIDSITAQVPAIAVNTQKVNSLSATLLIGEMPAMVQMANGGLGSGNANTIVTPSRIAGTPGKTYIIKTNRPVADGCYYAYGYYTHTVSSGNNYTNVKRTNPIDNKSKTNTLTLSSDEVAFSWVIAQVNILTGEFVKLRISDFYDYGYYVTVGEVTAIDSMATTSQLDELTGMHARYRDREANIASMCRYRKVTASPNKDYQFLIATDIHNSYTGGTPSLNSTIPGIVDALKFRTINSLFIMGDIVNGTYEPVNLSLVMDYFKQNSPKPFYAVVGNHEVGTAKFIGACASHEQMYEKIVMPMVEAGCLVEGEHTEGVPYWYHDDATYKIRLIGLYEYDDPMDIDETYWKPIEYDSSLPNIAANKSYVVGDKVNTYMYNSFPSQKFEYKEYSFECVQACSTGAAPVTSTKAPSYKIQRGSRVIRQVQAQWFLDTLASTPANYGVIVLMHNPFSDTATSVQAKFTQTADVKGSAYSQNLMQTDFIRNAVVAFVNGDNYNEDVIMKGDAAYLNSLDREPSGTHDGYSYAYNASKDFSTKNSGVTFLGFVGGHTHIDYVWKDATENIYQVSPCCSSSNFNQQKGNDISGTPEDASLTVASLTSSRIAMAKIGANVTIDGKLRDYEVITK